MRSRKERVKEFTHEYWNSKCNDPALFDLFSDSLLYRTIIGTRVGRHSYQQYGENWLSSFPDYHIEIISMEEVDTTVVVSCMCRGTHTNQFIDSPVGCTTRNTFLEQFNERPPSGSQLHVPLHWICDFNGSEIERLITVYDTREAYNQLGITPHNSSISRGYRVYLDEIEKKLSISFSTREAEIFALTCCGMSSKHIGELLGRSHRTIETYLSRCYQKLDCYGKQHAIDLMHENGVLILWLDLAKHLLKANVSKKSHAWDARS
jgi:DNA-binding CsgD family transcriptional regulator